IPDGLRLRFSLCSGSPAGAISTEAGVVPRARRLQLTPQLGLPGEKRNPRKTLGKALFRPRARRSWDRSVPIFQNGVGHRHCEETGSLVWGDAAELPPVGDQVDRYDAAACD